MSTRPSKNYPPASAELSGSLLRVGNRTGCAARRFTENRDHISKIIGTQRDSVPDNDAASYNAAGLAFTVITSRGRQVGATTVDSVHAALTSPPGHEVQNVHSFPPRARLHLVRDRCRPARGMLAGWPKPIQAALHRPGE